MNFRLTAALFALIVVVVVGLLIYSQLDDDKATDGGLVSKFAVGLKEKDVDTVEIVRTNPGEEKLVFVRVGPDKWELRQPTTAKVESFALDALVRAVWTAKPTKYPGLTDNPAAYGLDKPSYTITLKHKGDRSVTVAVGNTTIGGNDAFTFVTTTERPKTPIAIRAGDLKILYKDGFAGRDGPAAGKAKWLGDFRSRRLLSADVSNPSVDIESLSMSQGMHTLSLKRTPQGNWDFVSPAGFGEADIGGDTVPNAQAFTGVRPLLNLLSSLQAGGPDDFIENVLPANYSNYGLSVTDPGVIRIEVKTKEEAEPEVIFLGKPVEVPMGAPPGPTRIYARRQGDSAIVKVTTDRLAALAFTVANPGELRNRDLIAESSKQRIGALDITVGTDSYRLRKLGNSQRWAVYSGTDPREANKFAVQQLIEALAKPRAAKAVLVGKNDAAFTPVELKGEVKLWYGGNAEAPATPEAIPVEPKLGPPNAVFQLGKIDADGQCLRRTVDGVVTEFKVAPDLVAAMTKKRIDYVDAKLPRWNPTLGSNLKFNRGVETLELKKTPAQPGDNLDPFGRWYFVLPADRVGQSADVETVFQRLLMTLGTLQGKVVTDVPTPEELKKWGLEPVPRMRIAVEMPEGNPKSLIYDVGIETEDKQSVFLKLASQPYVFTVPKEFIEIFMNTELRDRVIFRNDLAKINKLVLNGWKSPPGNAPRQIVLEKKDGVWTSLAPDYPVDDAKVKTLLGTLRAPRLLEFVTDIKPVEQGLTPANGSLQIFIYSEGSTEPIWIDLSSKEEAGKIGIFATASSVNNSVFRIDGGYFKGLVLDPKTLQK